MVGDRAVPGLPQASLLHFREKEGLRTSPFRGVAVAGVLVSWLGRVDCGEPLGREFAPPVEERPPNLGSLDTMAVPTDGFSSIRRQ